LPRIWGQLLGGLLLVLASLACVQQAGQPETKNVKVTVVAILASTTSKEVDPRLKCIAEEFRKKHPEYTGFSVPVMDRKSLPVGQKTTFELVEKQVAQVTIVHAADAKNWVGLKVKPPRLGEIEYAAVCGKFLPIFTPYETRDHERLIVAVRVQPCHGRK